jgi:hypothetical protein
MFGLENDELLSSLTRKHKAVEVFGATRYQTATFYVSKAREKNEHARSLLSKPQVCPCSLLSRVVAARM